MPDELYIGPFPPVISRENKEKLALYFGAIKVSHLKRKCREIFVLAKFDSDAKCDFALKKIHQMEVLGKRISAKYYIPSIHRKLIPAATVTSSESSDSALKLKTSLMKYEAELNSISSNFDVNFPINPKLRYVYPSPNPTVLANIAHALVSVPKFYTQVLHLMNKMNLPNPFGPLTPEPALCKEAKSHTNIFSSKEEQMSAETNEKERDELSSVPLPPNSTSESELESDGETNPIQTKDKPLAKRPVKRKSKIMNKRPKLDVLKQTLLQPKDMSSKDKQETTDLKEVFDMPTVNLKRTLSVNVSQDLDKSTVESDVVANVEKGFGKIYPQTQEAEVVPSEESRGKFISLEELKKNRIAEAEWPIVPVFKNYSKGAPTAKLYIKNLAKNVNEADLKFVLGRFISEGESIEDAQSFNLRIMKEGRMKGQAFVTFSSVESATLALESTNGFILKDKPMVIAYGKIKANE